MSQRTRLLMSMNTDAPARIEDALRAVIDQCAEKTLTDPAACSFYQGQAVLATDLLQTIHERLEHHGRRAA